MPTYVAMLRGINVSGQKIIKMERLREAFGTLGFGEVKTHVQSGNVVFKSAKSSTASLAGKITEKILAEFGFSVSVLVRTPEDLGLAFQGNPFLKQAGIDESRLHVTFLSEPAPKTAEEILKTLTAKSERFAVCGREVYLYCPEGYGNTKLSNSAIEKKLSVRATTRNWKTVNVLVTMTQPWIRMSKPLAFKTAADLRSWLADNHGKCEGIWLRIFKKDSGKETVTYVEALDQALCFGWIDGQRKTFDELSFIQRFTPRRARSAWSKLNTQHVKRLIKAGHMTSAGLAVVEAAQADGRWQAAYESARNTTLPSDFLKALGRNKKAKAFFESLNKTNVYAIVYRLNTAKKPETRERRLQTILAMLKRREKFH